jgi:hypothetical protein
MSMLFRARGENMAYELREGQANAFRNDKEGNDRRPDFTGNGMLDGKPVRVSIWKKKKQDKELFLSLTLQRPDASRSTPKRPMTDVSSNNTPVSDIDDDIPF